jgi:hypothetical protein
MDKMEAPALADLGLRLLPRRHPHDRLGSTWRVLRVIEDSKPPAF